MPYAAGPYKLRNFLPPFCVANQQRIDGIAVSRFLYFSSSLGPTFMSRFRKNLSLFCGCVFAVWASSGVALASDAKALKKIGSGEASYTSAAGATTKIAGTGNEAIPERSVIKTGTGAEVFIEAFPGAVITVRQNSEVMIEKLSSSTRTARLMVKSGKVLSVLDPAKKANTDFAIVTAKSVVTARGTVFFVTVIPSGGDTNITVATLSGVVRIDRGPGQPPLDVPYGMASVNSAAAQTLAALVAN